jgi:NDP-sugar pyrophosphorylase family protein
MSGSPESVADSGETDGALSPVRQAVLLVGGLGTRLRPLTYRLPKALMPVANLPLIAYEIIPLVRAGVTRIVLAMGYKADSLRSQLGDGEAWGAELVYAEETEPLDTAGAIANAAGHLDGPFFACNGDMIYDVDLVALARAHVEHQALVTFCLRQAPDISHFGLIQWADGGQVTAFKEKAACDEAGRNTVNSGFYVMSPEIMDHIPGGCPYSSERQLFPDLLARGLRLHAHQPDRQGYWADVGRVETYLQSSGDVLEGALSWFSPRNLGEVADGARVHCSVDVQVGAVVMAGATVGERVAVGAGCVIEQDCVIRDSILWPGSRVGAGARVEGSIIAGATVAPGQQVLGEVIVG